MVQINEQRNEIKKKKIKQEIEEIQKTNQMSGNKNKTNIEKLKRGVEKEKSNIVKRNKRRTQKTVNGIQ